VTQELLVLVVPQDRQDLLVQLEQLDLKELQEIQDQLDQQAQLAFKVIAQDSYMNFLHLQAQVTLAVVCLSLIMQHWHL
jgi:hypothetical protein